MTTGIYLLGFDGTPKVYIGQSSNIEERIKYHIRQLKNGGHSKKMQAAYTEFGLPEGEILEEGDYLEEKLNELENYHIKLWDAVDDGFNTLEHAADTPNLYGETHGMSKFSNIQIKEVFLLLVNKQDMSFKDISKVTGVSYDTVRQISRGKVHSWLKCEFPAEYTTLESLTGLRNNRTTAKYKGIVYPGILDPLGNLYNVENTREFAREHGLNSSHLGKVLNGKQKTHKGWKLAT